jgi:tetratricopeptide (TPR) repeat protein
MDALYTAIVQWFVDNAVLIGSISAFVTTVAAFLGWIYKPFKSKKELPIPDDRHYEAPVAHAALLHYFDKLKVNIPPHMWQDEFDKFLMKHQELVEELQTIKSKNEEVIQIKTLAREALERVELDEAERLIDLALKTQTGNMREDLIALAETFAEKAQLMELRIRYKEAAENYAQAAKYLPSDEEYGELKADYHIYSGNNYYHAGLFNLVETHYLETKSIREKVFGPDHPSVATTLNNLAGLYRAQGKYDEALPFYQRSLEIRENKLGKDHPDVAQSLNNLAAIYDSQGKYDEALPFYQRSLEIRENKLGKDHPDVATTLNNLALLYKAQGKFDEAEPYYLQCVEIFENAKMEVHPSLPTVYTNYSIFLYETGRDEEAHAYEVKAAAAQAKLDGLNPPQP